MILNCVLSHQINNSIIAIELEVAMRRVQPTIDDLGDGYLSPKYCKCSAAHLQYLGVDLDDALRIAEQVEF